MSRLDDLINDRAGQLQAQEEQRFASSGPPVIKRESDLSDFAGGFADSAFSSVGELFGFDPTDNAVKFRNEHAIGGFISEIVSPVGIYGAVFKAGKVIKPFARFIDNIGDVARAPIKTTALQEAVRFAPFEASRIAGAAIANEGNVEDVAASALLNTAVIGVIGGGIGAFRSSFGGRSEASTLSRVFPGIADGLPPSIALKTIRDRIKTKEFLPQFAKEAKVLERQWDFKVRNVDNTGHRKNQTFISSIIDGKDPEPFRRIFDKFDTNVQKAGGRFRSKLVPGENPGQFPNEEFVNVVFKSFGLDRNITSNTQIMRHIFHSSKKKAAETQNILTRRMESIGDGWYMTREGNKGLYIMAKKRGVNAGNPIGLPNIGDEFLFVKTDSPGLFAKSSNKWANQQTAMSSFFLRQARKENIEGLHARQALEKLLDDVSLDDYLGLNQSNYLGNSKSLTARFAKASGMQRLIEGGGTGAETARAAVDVFDRFLAPTLFQFTKNPIARMIFGAARFTHERSNAMAKSLLFGEQNLKEGERLAGVIYRTKLGKGISKDGRAAIIPMIEKLTQRDLDDVWKIWNRNLNIEDVAIALKEGRISQNAANFLERMSEIDEYIVDQLIRTQAAAGVTAIEPTVNYFAITRTLRGDGRVILRDGHGNAVYIASGRGEAAAMKEAQAMKKLLAEDGLETTTSESFLRSDLEEIGQQLHDFKISGKLAETIKNKREQLAKLKEGTRPGSFGGRREGIKTSADFRPFTARELKETVTRHITQQQRYLADITVKDTLGPLMDGLYQENGKIFSQLSQRLDDLSGLPSKFAVSQNRILDAALSGLLGKDSATKIVSAANQLTFAFQLGMGNLMFPVLNAMTFIQTSLPQVAMIMRMPKPLLSRYYSWMALEGANTQLKGGAGILNIFKLAGRSIKELGDAGRVDNGRLMRFFNRAIEDGVIDPKLVEEIVGQAAKRIVHLRETLANDGFVAWMRALSEFLPGSSEKFARGHSFVMGYNLGRDFLGLTDDALYHFSKEFTEKTMFLYGTADRARIITGPIGSAFGLFKNWQMHYIGWMGAYTGMAFKGVAAGRFGDAAPLLWQLGGTAAVGGHWGITRVCRCQRLFRMGHRQKYYSKPL